METERRFICGELSEDQKVTLEELFKNGIQGDLLPCADSMPLEYIYQCGNGNKYICSPYLYKDENDDNRVSKGLVKIEDDRTPSNKVIPDMTVPEDW